MKTIVSIVMGSDSDLEIMSEASQILQEFRIGYEIDIVSAHRTPNKLFSYAQNLRERGIRVVIAGAGGSAHLPGMIASLTTIPVIGVPILSKNSILGIDSILSILQMPAGVPVATVALNGAKNAGLLAVQILALSDEELQAMILDYRDRLRDHVIQKSTLMHNSTLNT